MSTTPKTVGNYDLISKLGRGSFADVYLAVNKLNGTHFAFKVIAKEKVIDPKYPKLQDNLDNEISIMRDYRHENIVRLFDSFHSPRYIYLVLELCSGGDLSNFIKKNKRLEESVARRFLHQLSRGLTFLNEKNIIHRDLKPANVLLSESSSNAVLKLADFGFARQLSEAAMAQTQCGTPYYMAPEIFEMHDYDSRADLWSTGCIYYEMLSGHPPFKGINPKDLLNNIKTKQLSFPADLQVSKESIIVLKKLLAINPKQRATLKQLCLACELLVNSKAVDNTKLSGSEIILSDSGAINSSQFTSMSALNSDTVSNNSVSFSPPQVYPSSRITDRLTLNNPSSSTTTFAMNLNNSNLISTVTTSMKSQSPITNLKTSNHFTVVQDSIESYRNRRHSTDGFTENINQVNISKPNEIDLKKIRSISADSSNSAKTDKPNHNGESWSSEDDFVIVESSSTYLNLANKSSKDFKVEGNLTLSSFIESQKSGRSSSSLQSESLILNGLLQYSERINVVVVQVCLVGDSFVNVANKSLEQLESQDRNRSKLFNISEYQFVVDSYATAFSLYNHAMKINAEALFCIIDVTKSNQFNNSITMDKLKMGLVNLLNGLLSRSENCVKKIKLIKSDLSSTVVNIPTAEPVLYSLAIKMSNDSNVESLLGNLNRSQQYLSSSKILLESLMYTVQDNNIKIVQQQLLSISNQLNKLTKSLSTV